MGHLSEPIKDHFFLVFSEGLQAHEERLMPEDLRISDHLVDQVDAID